MKFSISPLDWFSTAYLLGTVSALLFLPSFPAVIFFTLFLLLIASIRFSHRWSRARSILILGAVFLLALFRVSGFPARSLTAGYATIRGYLGEPPVLSDRNQTFTLVTDRGRFLVRTDLKSEYSYGDRLEIAGLVRKINGLTRVDFPKIRRLPGSSANPLFKAVFSYRESFQKTLSSILPEPQSSLASGVLLGTAGFNDREFLKSLRVSGTSHVVSVSGYNISVLISGLIMILSLSSTIVFISFLVPLVLLFDLSVGFTPPVLRATLMGFFLLSAKILGRQRSLGDALVFSAALIAFLDPEALLSLSFQLSFLATAGIIFLYPPLRPFFKPLPKELKGLGDITAATLTAQYAVLPVTLYNFGTFSLVSPVANLLVAGTIVPLMGLTFLTGFFGQIFYPLGQFFGALDLVLLTYFVKVIELLARIPWASIQL